MQTTAKTSARQQAIATAEQRRAPVASAPVLISPELLQLVGGGKAAPSEYTTVNAAAPKNGW